MKKNLWLNLGIVTALAAIATGCATWAGRGEGHHANSLYNYLYADQTGHVDTATIPVLSLPLHVGIAFVPTDSPNSRSGVFSTSDNGFTENQKMELMKQISDVFRTYPFVGSIDEIPSAYLRPRGGFPNLEQIRTMYGVDVIVLLSYDQVQFTDEGLLSLSYWTIVGAYVVSGEKNDTETMLDGAVYDIASHKMLFRAPGLSKIKGSATLINLNEDLREDSQRSYKEAGTNLVASLKVQLESFKQRVKQSPADYKVVTKPGYKGAAAFGGLEATLAGGMAVCYLWTRRKYLR